MGSLHGKHRVRIGETEVEAKDWTLNVTQDYVDVGSWEEGGGSKTYLAGLTDTHGSFSGFLDGGLDDGAVEVYLYGPAVLPWYKAWWVRLRGKEWPDAVIAHGPAIVSSTYSKMADDEEVLVNGTFNGAGKWTFTVHDQSWTAKWDRLMTRFWYWRHRKDEDV